MARQSGPSGRPGQKGPVFNEMIWLRRWPRLVSTCFIILILLEILAFVWVADKIGLGLTLLALIGSAFVGLWLIRRTGLDMVGKLRLTLAQGQEPGHSLIDGACFVVAGLFLILPGFFSDILALLLMLPMTRNWLIRYFAAKVVGATVGGMTASGTTKPAGGKVISDVEFHEVATPATPATPASAEPPAAASGKHDQAGDPGNSQAGATDSKPVMEPEILAPIRSTPPSVSPSVPAASPKPDEDEGSAESGEAGEAPHEGETPAEEDERWGQAPRRPIIDVEES